MTLKKEYYTAITNKNENYVLYIWKYLQDTSLSEKRKTWDM